jgi:hypothetical protein
MKENVYAPRNWKVASDWMLAPEMRAALEEMATRCSGDDLITLIGPGDASVEAVAYAVGVDELPPRGHTHTGRGSAKVVAWCLRHYSGLRKLAAAIEEAAEVCPADAVVVVHAEGDRVGVLHCPRTFDARGVG